MLSIVIALFVFGATCLVSSLIMFRYGTRDNQTTPPSNAAQTTFICGTLIAIIIASTYGLW